MHGFNIFTVKDRYSYYVQPTLLGGVIKLNISKLITEQSVALMCRSR